MIASYFIAESTKGTLLGVLLIAKYVRFFAKKFLNDTKTGSGSTLIIGKRGIPSRNSLHTTFFVSLAQIDLIGHV